MDARGAQKRENAFSVTNPSVYLLTSNALQQAAATVAVE